MKHLKLNDWQIFHGEILNDAIWSRLGSEMNLFDLFLTSFFSKAVCERRKLFETMKLTWLGWIAFNLEFPAGFPVSDDKTFTNWNWNVNWLVLLERETQDTNENFKIAFKFSLLQNILDLASFNREFRNTHFWVFYVSCFIIATSWDMFAAESWKRLTSHPAWFDRNTVAIARVKCDTDCVRITSRLWDENVARL